MVVSTSWKGLGEPQTLNAISHRRACPLFSQAPSCLWPRSASQLPYHVLIPALPNLLWTRSLSSTQPSFGAGHMLCSCLSPTGHDRLGHTGQCEVEAGSYCLTSDCGVDPEVFLRFLGTMINYSPSTVGLNTLFFWPKFLVLSKTINQSISKMKLQGRRCSLKSLIKHKHYTKLKFFNLPLIPFPAKLFCST